VQLIFQYATPIGLENIGWKYFIVHVPWIVIEFLVIYFFLPETKGYALEEIAILFGECHTKVIELIIRWSACSFGRQWAGTGGNP
jgi:hypothetical protein